MRFTHTGDFDTNRGLSPSHWYCVSVRVVWYLSLLVLLKISLPRTLGCAREHTQTESSLYRLYTLLHTAPATTGLRSGDPAGGSLGMSFTLTTCLWREKAQPGARALVHRGDERARGGRGFLAGADHQRGGAPRTPVSVSRPRCERSRPSRAVLRRGFVNHFCSVRMRWLSSSISSGVASPLSFRYSGR